MVAPSGTDTIEGASASAQFGGATSSGVSDTKGQFSLISLICRAAGAWDAVASDGTAVRGFGNVLWYPVASRPVFLGDGVHQFGIGFDGIDGGKPEPLQIRDQLQ